MLERSPHPDILDTGHWRDGRPHALHRDYETRSPADLKALGAHRFAADPRTEIVCAAYAVDDGPVRMWLPGNAVPSEFIEAARNPNWTACAHNDQFEAAIEQHILAPRSADPLRETRVHASNGTRARLAGTIGYVGEYARAREP